MRVLILLLLVSFANANEKSISLQQAIDLAKQNSWNVKQEKLSFEKVQLQRRQVIATILPQVSTSASYSNYITKPVVGGNATASTHQTDLALIVRQKLFEFGGIASSLDAASAMLSLAEFKKEQVAAYAELETKIAYFSVLLAQEQLKIAQESYNNSKRNLQILRNSFGAGRAPRGDVLKLETDIVSKQSQVNTAQSSLKTADLALKDLLKIPENQNIILSTKLNLELPQLDKKTVSEKVIEENLELKLLKQKVIYQDNVAKVQRSSALPKIGLFYNLGTSTRSEDQAFASDQRIDNQVVGVELNWSIWDGGGNSARYQEAKNEAMFAEYELRKSNDKLLKDLSTYLSEYNEIRTNISIDEQSLRLAQQSFNFTQELLGAGKSSITDLNSTEGLLNSIKANYAVKLFRAQERLSLIQFLMNMKDAK